MSGVEIAGLVLGSFPLLISALEHYRNGAETMLKWHNFRHAYKKCRRDLRFYEYWFDQTLRQCLLPLVVDDNELEELINDPTGEAWRDSHLEAKLAARLPQSYSLYLEIVLEIFEMMEKLKDELGIERSSLNLINSSPLPDRRKGWLDYEYERLKFSFNEKRRDDIFDKMKELITRLHELLNMSKKSARMIESRHKSNNVKSEEVLAEDSRKMGRLYTLISQAWGCGCRLTHCTGFLLHHRNNVIEDYALAFLDSRESPSQARITWGWQKAVLKRMRKTLMPDYSGSSQASNSISGSSLPGSSSTGPVTTTQSKRRLPLSRNAKIMSIRDGKSKGPARPTPTDSTLNNMGNSIAPGGPNPTTTVSTALPLQLLPPTARKITKLCSSLVSHRDDPSLLGYLEGDKELYCIYTTVQQQDFNTENIVNLGDILRRASGPIMSRADRYSIALMIASSLVEVQSTPWLDNTWDKDEVVFITHDEDGNTVQMKEPYILRDVPHRPTPPIQPQECNFISLGIILLELCFGIPIESQPGWSKHGLASMTKEDPERSFFLEVIARKWSQQVGEEAGPEYFEAVDWCLRFNRLPGQKRGWRNDLVQTVVANLECCQINKPLAAD